jgi:hypothetical protein
MTSGGGRITPRWTELTSSPPSNLGKGEIATSLTGRILYVGRGGPAAPISFRTDYVTPQQLAEAVGDQSGFNANQIFQGMPNFFELYEAAKL